MLEKLAERFGAAPTIACVIVFWNFIKPCCHIAYVQT